MEDPKFEKHNYSLKEEKVAVAYDAMSDSKIWKLFLEGDGEAFNHIYYHYFPILFNYGHQFCNDRALIKDLIQDLFVYLKVKRKQLGNTDNIKFYLFKSLKRNIFKSISKNKRFLHVNDFQVSTDFEISLSHETLMINNHDQIVLKKRLQEGLNQLTKRQKEAIIYYYYEGFDYNKIAELMEFSKAEYARKLIYRSLDKLKKFVPSTWILIFLSSLTIIPK